LCKACNLRQVQEYGNCAYCRGPLTKQDFIHLPRENRLNLPKEDLKDATFPSTKMLALKEHIAAMLPEDKAVVFSQFLGMLDLLERDLISSSIGYVVTPSLSREWRAVTPTSNAPNLWTASKPIRTSVCFWCP
jgi:SNF2 family DNA or RNA helicase